MSITQQQKENTRKFLTSFNIINQMRTAGDDENYETTMDHSAEMAILGEPRPFDTSIEIGDIRILSQTEEPQYVVILEKRDWCYLVVPFSHYSFPATDNELKLDWDGGLYLEVAQVWNSRTIATVQLEKSWFVTKLPEKILEEILAVRDHYICNNPLPENLLNRTGTPIVRSDDPRFEYQQQSIEVFAEIDRVDFELLNKMEKENENEKVHSDH